MAQANPSTIVEHAVHYFMHLRQCGLQPSLSLKTLPSGIVCASSSVYSNPQAVNFQNSKTNLKHRSGQRSRTRRKQKRNLISPSVPVAVVTDFPGTDTKSNHVNQNSDSLDFSGTEFALNHETSINTSQLCICGPPDELCQCPTGIPNLQSDSSDLHLDASSSSSIPSLDQQPSVHNENVLNHKLCRFCETEFALLNDFKTHLRKYGFICYNCLDFYSDMTWYPEAVADLRFEKVGAVPASTSTSNSGQRL